MTPAELAPNNQIGIGGVLVRIITAGIAGTDNIQRVVSLPQKRHVKVNLF